MQEKPYRLPDGQGLYRRIVGNDLLNTKKKGEKLASCSLFSLYLGQIALRHYSLVPPLAKCGREGQRMSALPCRCQVCRALQGRACSW